MAKKKSTTVETDPNAEPIEAAAEPIDAAIDPLDVPADPLDVAPPDQDDGDDILVTASEDLDFTDDLLVGAPDEESEPLVPGSGLGLVEELSLQAQVEALVFASPKPVQAAEIVDFLAQTISLKEAESLLDGLVETYEMRGGGFKLEYLKGMGYQFRTVPAAAPIMERMYATRPRPISRAALETLSIIAYRQPVTRADIEFIRGVDAGSIIKNLLERDLIACVGRKEDSGRPMLFGTTQEFLKIFRLSHLSELPSLQSFQPAVDTMNAALKQLENPNSVDVEQFVGDSEQPQPDFSEGLVAEDTGSADRERELEGASVKNGDQPDSDDGLLDTNENMGEIDAHSEVAVPSGDSLPPRGGTVDPSEEDLS